MGKYKVAFERRAAKTLTKMDKFERAYVVSWINKNLVDTDDPRRHGKPLVGNLRDKWRYRVGNYRLIAEISDETVTILVLEIGHRRDVYNH